MTFEPPSLGDRPGDRPGDRSTDRSSIPILSVGILLESDVVTARQRARQIAGFLRFDVHQQTKIATAVSEIARNAFNYGNGGRVDFSIEGNTLPQSLVIRVTDSGRGIPNLRRILEGDFHSETGMGVGIIGARRLMDRFEIVSPPGQGVAVTMSKALPHRAPLVTKLTLASLVKDMSRQPPAGSLGEMQQQNRELLTTLEELAARQEELVRLNRELEDTNRGVVALYAELDDKAEHLRNADETKSRFLSHMSHEFRTPLNSILALTRLLLDRADGELTAEQERQVSFVRRSAECLFDLVNDLLDLAKVQAGKTTVHAGEFDVKNLFGALRGMLRPLLVNQAVNLVFDDPENLPPVVSDEGKVSQILRNLISNALKFTERGEVRVSARFYRERSEGDRSEGDPSAGDRLIFSVADTGIGIDPADQERIFQEFTQLESAIQRTVRGTGLGLPLSRKLAELLGGTLTVESSPGVGSTFFLTIPAGTSTASPTPDPAEWEAAGKLPVLIVDSRQETRTVYQEYLEGSRYHTVAARGEHQARAFLDTFRPAAVILDIDPSGGGNSPFLTELKARNDTKDIPVLAIDVVSDSQGGFARGADAYTVRPVSRKWLLECLDRYTRPAPVAHRILLVDDDPTFRYLVRQIFAGMTHEFIEADTGVAGLQEATLRAPELIFLDLMMPKMTGYELLERLRSEPKTRDIPVIVVSSRFLNDHDLGQLQGWGAASLSKDRFAHADLIPSVRTILEGFGLGDLLPNDGRPANSGPPAKL